MTPQQKRIILPVFSFNSLTPEAQAFKARVLADGGTFEALGCLSSAFNRLQSLNQIATTFNLRVAADSGTFESINCVQTIITDLQNININ